VNHCKCQPPQPGYDVYIHGRPEPIHVPGAVGHNIKSEVTADLSQQAYLVLWNDKTEVIASFDYTKCVVGFVSTDPESQEK
jgi:hypothetical protein